MIRNLRAFLAEMLDAAISRATRTGRPIPVDLHQAWQPDHIHLTDQRCGYRHATRQATPDDQDVVHEPQPCGLTGFHFHDHGRTFRTLTDYQADRAQTAS